MSRELREAPVTEGISPTPHEEQNPALTIRVALGADHPPGEPGDDLSSG